MWLPSMRHVPRKSTNSATICNFMWNSRRSLWKLASHYPIQMEISFQFKIQFPMCVNTSRITTTIYCSRSSLMGTLVRRIFQQPVQSSQTCTPLRTFESMTTCWKFVLARQSFLLPLTFVRRSVKTARCIASYSWSFMGRSRIKWNGNRRLKRCAKISSRIFSCPTQEHGHIIVIQIYICIRMSFNKRGVINSNLYHFLCVFALIILE